MAEQTIQEQADRSAVADVMPVPPGEVIIRVMKGAGWKKIVPAVLALALVAWVVLPKVFAPPKADAARPLSPVLLETAAEGTLDETFRFTGYLKPETNTTVVSKVPGRILEILVKEGDRVKEGQLLVRMEDDVVRLQMEQARAGWEAAQAQYRKADTGVRPEELASAKASLAQAEADLQVARNNLERSRKLFEAGTLPRAKYEDARNQVNSGETQVANARRQVDLMEQGARPEDIAMARAQADASHRQLDLARLQLDNANVTAPMAGTVVKVHANRGQMAGGTTPLVTIVGDDTILALVQVPEVHYGSFYRRESGYKVDVRPVAYPDREPFAGHITRVGEMIDGASRSFEMEVGVDNRQGLLKPGMFVTLETRTPWPGTTVTVPRTAVLLRDGKQVVFVAVPVPGTGGRDGATAVQMKEVETGEYNMERIQIRKGLSVGDRVVVQGNNFLEDMQYVRVANQS